MRNSFTCGAEQSLRRNGMLLGLREDVGTTCLWEGELRAAFRYSFVPDHFDLDRRAVAELLDELGLISKGAVQWVVGWRYVEADGGKLHSRFLKSALVREGWSVCTQTDIGLASRMITSPEQLAQPPVGTERDLQGFFVVIGGRCEVRDLAIPPFAASTRHFCKVQRLEPSESFVSGLLERGSAVAYISVASDARGGVVLVGPQPMAPDLSALSHSGFVSKIYWNEDAAAVWGWQG